MTSQTVWALFFTQTDNAHTPDLLAIFPERRLCEFAPSVLSELAMSALESDSILPSGSRTEKLPQAELSDQVGAIIIFIYLALLFRSFPHHHPLSPPPK